MALDSTIPYTAETECPHCEEKVKVRFDIQDLEPISFKERGMGTETEYIFTEEVECPRCKKI